MIKNSHAEMRGRPSNYLRGDFAILRVNGLHLGRPKPPRYCYELQFKGRFLKRFEYQYQARNYLDPIMREYREIMYRREKEEESFMHKHDLPSFPERVNT
jgi:hypothetical protein